jgi:Holliday junction resolvase RusA-like endonuclease
MQVLAFSMSGEPRGKGRPRVDTRGAFPRMHTDSKTIKYEASITREARAQMAGREPLEGPLSVSLRFRMPIPKSAAKRAKAAMAAGEIAHCGPPDVDNLAKAVLDGIATDALMRRKAKTVEERQAARVVFRNDSQIVRLFVTKIYAEQPGVDVRIEAFQPQGQA